MSAAEPVSVAVKKPARPFVRDVRLLFFIAHADSERILARNKRNTTPETQCREGELYPFLVDFRLHH